MSERIAVVTGANRGLGAAISVSLAREGFTIAATARDASTLGDTIAQVEAVGGTAHAIACDVGDEESVDVASAAIDELGPVHTVVANAGVAGPTALLHEMELADWRSTLVTDLDGVFLTFRAFVPGLIGRGEGSLIAISSMTGKRPLVGRTPYCAAKMGVIGIMRTLALELGPHGIRANAVCPGAIAGPRIDEVIKRQAETRGIDEAEALAAFTSASPLERLVEAEEVADACAFLASDAAKSITGEDLNVSAGVVMY
jgi:NAD(P)-dependent dehydrogenase (short-subunit alcohol dehydrogenase family)